MADTPPADPDVTTLLTTDHRDMLDLLVRIGNTPDPEDRRDLADTVTAEVMRHSVAEEMYLYPQMETHLPNGVDEVEHDKKEHAEIVGVMKQLEDTDASDAEFRGLVRKLTKLLEHHAEDEEADQFPKLREHFTQDQLVEMGKKVDSAKRVAPTRPHPSAPHSELFHKTVGPGIGMVDRLRDELTNRVTE